MPAVIVLDDGTTIVPYNSSRTGPQMDAAMDGGDSVGNLTNLTTTEKSSVVGAINEVNGGVTNAKGSLNLIGENLKNVQDEVFGTTNYMANTKISQRGVVSPEEGICVSDYIDVSSYSGQNLTIYCAGESQSVPLFIIEYNGSKEYVSNWSNEYYRTITVGSNTKYIRFSFVDGYSATKVRDVSGNVIYVPSMIEEGIKQELADAINDLSNTKESLSLLANEGKTKVSLSFDWQIGSINNDGTIDSTNTSFVYSRLFSANEINGSLYTNTIVTNCYPYVYNENGTFYNRPPEFSETEHTFATNFIASNRKVRFVMGVTKYSNAKVYQFVKKLVTELDLLEINRKPEIIIPDTIIAIPNEEFDVHYDNIVSNYDATLIPYKEAFGSAPYGMKDFARCKNANAGTYTAGFHFGFYVPNSYSAQSLPDTIIRKSITFKVIPANSGSGTNRKVILIGDSWTANGAYAKELKRLFDDENEPMDITLLGTLGTDEGHHEGRGGWSSKTYCTAASYNSYNNAFRNPTTELFDFSYYMQSQDYTSVDDVFINLGINDTETVESLDEIIGYYDQMINSIHAYNSNVKIFIGLCGLPAEYEYTYSSNRIQRIKSRRLLLHSRLMAEYGGKESQNLFIVPLHLSIDCRHDFPISSMPRSYRDQTPVEYCTDAVHPTNVAYNKIADRIRTYIKYVETVQ